MTVLSSWLYHLHCFVKYTGYSIAQKKVTSLSRDANCVTGYATLFTSYVIPQWWIQGSGPGGLDPPPLFLDKTEARRAAKHFLETRPPRYLKAWIRHCSCIPLCDSHGAPWHKNCKYHGQSSWAIPRISGKAWPGLTRVQIFTYASCRLLRIIYFVEDWYLRICAKHAFKKVILKPLHHLENYIFLLKTLRWYKI